MTARTVRLPRLLELLLRIVIGAVFVYAGWAKIFEPEPLADSIASFQILPRMLIVPLALSLPPFEMLSGALLIVGWPRRIAALAIVIVTAVFLVALLSAVARGITIDCGCFGQAAAGVPTAMRMWLDLGRDLLLLFGAVVLYRASWPSGAPAATTF
jgi:putative oxidoreductase